MGVYQEMAGVYKMLSPLLTTVNEQTSMLPPAWMGTLSGGTSTSCSMALEGGDGGGGPGMVAGGPEMVAEGSRG